MCYLGRWHKFNCWAFTNVQYCATHHQMRSVGRFSLSTAVRCCSTFECLRLIAVWRSVSSHKNRTWPGPVPTLCHQLSSPWVWIKTPSRSHHVSSLFLLPGNDRNWFLSILTIVIALFNLPVNNTFSRATGRLGYIGNVADVFVRGCRWETTTCRPWCCRVVRSSIGRT